MNNYCLVKSQIRDFFFYDQSCKSKTLKMTKNRKLDFQNCSKPNRFQLLPPPTLPKNIKLVSRHGLDVANSEIENFHLSSASGTGEPCNIHPRQFHGYLWGHHRNVTVIYADFPILRGIYR